MHRSFRTRAWVTASLLLCAAAAQAGDHGSRVAPLPKYQEECGACHVAFPVGGLPAASWGRLMSNLPKHFGTDASLDAATTQQLSQWLQANAGNGRRAREVPPEDRLTRSAWFQREHDEVGAETWKRASVKSPANCSACHTNAAQGRFSEHEIRIPK